MARWLEVYENRWSQLSGLEEMQGGSEDRMLPHLLTRCIQRVAVTKRDKERSGRPNPFRDVPKELDRDGGNSLAF